MRVVFDGYWWMDGPPSGKMVVRELVAAWIDEFPDDSVLVAVPKRDVSKVAPLLSPTASLLPTYIPQHALSNALELYWTARREQADVVICQNFAPLFGKSTVFVHDVLFQTNPEWFSRSERLYLGLIPWLARRASTIVTSSSNEATRIVRSNPTLPKAIAVGLAPSIALTQAVPRQPTRILTIQGFFLSVARLNVRKNLATIIDASFRTKAVGPHSPLIVVGEPDGASENLPGSAKSMLDDGSLIFLGTVSDDELAWLYHAATALLFLSRDEGFGLPPVEARHFGCPVIVSDIPIFRETLGHDAVFVAPDDLDAIADAITAAAESPVQRAPHVHVDDWKTVARRYRTAIDSVGAA